MANKMVRWAITTSAAYAALETKEANFMYFLEDTGELYRGTVSFTESVNFVDAFPAKGAQGRVYVDSATLEGKVWNGTAWKTIIHPVAQTVDTKGTIAVSGTAVAKYVTEQFAAQVGGKFVEGITFDKATKELRYEKDGAEVAVPVDGFVTGVSYDGSKGKLTFAVEGEAPVEINLPKDNFVQSGSYDTETQEIVLSLVDGSEVRIPAMDLVDVYTTASTNTVGMTLVDNVFSADVKISATAGNLLVANNDGLFAQSTDITGKMDKVEAGKAGELLVADADGQGALSGVKVGGEALAGTPDGVTLATEKAVASIRTILQTNIDSKISKVDIAQAIGASADAAESKVASQKAVALGLEQLESKVVAKSSIVASVNAAAPSASKVTSEAAVVEALSWIVI